MSCLNYVLYQEPNGHFFNFTKLQTIESKESAEISYLSGVASFSCVLVLFTFIFIILYV